MPNLNEELLSIAAVEHDTGLGKDTLRVWERRYGFPRPLRDNKGERVYPRAQVTRLREVKRLLDAGMRPGKVFAADDAALAAMLGSGPGAARAKPDSRWQPLLDCLRLHRNDELRSTLQQLLIKDGLQRFVCEVVAPLNREVGDAWLRGQIDVPQEHAFTEQIQNLLRGATSGILPTGQRPRVLLTTFPDERHSLGLLMVEAMLVPEGSRCVSLGTQTPIGDIAAAVRAGDFDIVALSFSSAFPMRAAIAGLRQLVEILPDSVAIWAGGRLLSRRNMKVPRVQVITDIAAIPAELALWRSRDTAAPMPAAGSREN